MYLLFYGKKLNRPFSQANIYRNKEMGANWGGAIAYLRNTYSEMSYSELFAFTTMSSGFLISWVCRYQQTLLRKVVKEIVKRKGGYHIYPHLFFFVIFLRSLLLRPDIYWLLWRHQLPSYNLTFRTLSQHFLIRIKEMWYKWHFLFHLPSSGVQEKVFFKFPPMIRFVPSPGGRLLSEVASWQIYTPGAPKPSVMGTYFFTFPECIYLQGHETLIGKKKLNWHQILIRVSTVLFLIKFHYKTFNSA